MNYVTIHIAVDIILHTTYNHSNLEIIFNELYQLLYPLYDYVNILTF